MKHSILQFVQGNKSDNLNHPAVTYNTCYLLTFFCAPTSPAFIPFLKFHNKEEAKRKRKEIKRKAKESAGIFFFFFPILWIIHNLISKFKKKTLYNAMIFQVRGKSKDVRVTSGSRSMTVVKTVIDCDILRFRHTWSPSKNKIRHTLQFSLQWGNINLDVP